MNNLNHPHKSSFILPVLLIAVGTGWLLSVLNIVPDINWVWTLGLAAVGLAAFTLGGIDKVSVAIGPFFLIASLLSVLRQTGRLSIDVETPVLTIVAGVLLLVAQHPRIPAPDWLITPRDNHPEPQHSHS